jgi:hypothetical protein
LYKKTFVPSAFQTASLGADIFRSRGAFSPAVLPEMAECGHATIDFGLCGEMPGNGTNFHVNLCTDRSGILFSRVWYF